MDKNHGLPEHDENLPPGVTDDEVDGTDHRRRRVAARNAEDLRWADDNEDEWKLR
jgi:hypothetical protein